MRGGRKLIHLITAANRHLFEDELLEFRRISRQCLIADEAIGERIVQADREDCRNSGETIHILGVANGRVYGGSRLTPSTRPHLLSDVFPQLASVRGVPRGATVYAWTLAPALAQRQHHDLAEFGALLCGLMEYCLAEGIYAVSTIIEASSLPRFHDMGWAPRPLGLPEQIGGDWMLAVLMPVDGTTLEATRTFHGLGEPALVRRGRHPIVTREIGL